MRVLWLVVVCGCGRVGLDVDRATVDAAGVVDADVSDGAAQAIPWQLDQVVGATGSASIAIAAATSGSLVVVAIERLGSGVVTSVSDDATDTFSALSGAAAANCAGGSDEALEMWYAADAAGSATTIAVASASEVLTLVAWEFTGVRLTDALDAAASLSGETPSSTPVGPSITTSRPGEVVVAALIGGNVTTIAAGNAFTDDDSDNSNGFAHLTSPTAPAGTYQPQWNSADIQSCSGIAAFFAAD